jgi:hypothetical protein
VSTFIVTKNVDKFGMRLCRPRKSRAQRNKLRSGGKPASPAFLNLDERRMRVGVEIRVTERHLPQGRTPTYR